jgi:Arc/MetJ-type ribon-helix-helix transcriptional regulator
MGQFSMKITPYPGHFWVQINTGPYQSVSAYVEGLIRRDRASQEAAAFTQLQAELAAGFSAPESTYHPSSAAEVIARNRI